MLFYSITGGSQESHRHLDGFGGDVRPEIELDFHIIVLSNIKSVFSALLIVF